MTRLNKLTALAAVVALSGGLAACGGGSSKTTTMPEPMPPELTPQEQCENADGRWNSDTMMCTTAAQLAEEAEAATKAAGTKLTAINTEAGQETEAGLGGSGVTATGNDEGAYNLAVAADRKVTITVEGSTDDDDEKFMQAMDLGGGTTMHTRTMDANADGEVVQEVVIVSHTREAPTPVAFAEFETADGSMPQALNVRVDGETATDSMPNDALNVVAANLTHVKAGRFVAAAGTTGTTVLSFQHAVDDDDATDEDESRDAAMVPGTYNGAMGNYKCNASAANCTVTVNTEGVVSAVSNENDWIFIPTDGATSDQPDYDYLSYGFWLQKTTDSDGVVMYDEVETFASSSVTASEGGTLDTVNGSASYTGGATGVYVRHVYSAGGGELESSTSGHFTATAKLVAHFAGGSIPADDHNTVTGTISRFMLSGGETNDWSVALEGTRGSGANTISGTANGGGNAGTFSGTYYGAVTADDATTTDMNESVYPSSVAGEFNANFSNGAVAGAFGASQDE